MYSKKFYMVESNHFRRDFSYIGSYKDCLNYIYELVDLCKIAKDKDDILDPCIYCNNCEPHDMLYIKVYENRVCVKILEIRKYLDKYTFHSPSFDKNILN